MSLMLNNNNISDLPENVKVPSYDRSKVSPGILHIGVGNFHRAHMELYLDSLFNEGDALDWGIIGSGIQSSNIQMRKQLQDQDWLTTVVELDPLGYSPRVVGSMIDFAEVNSDSIVAALIDPRIRIVSLTVTEGGYFINAASEKFDTTHPDIESDVSNPEDPQTIFGILVKALSYRRNHDIKPFTLLSCDNLPGNGDVTKQSVLGFAKLIDSNLASWIESNVCFPNSMVDRIVPATTQRERTMVERSFGIIDANPVVCEPFIQWIIEDKFSSGRPPLERVGVQFVDNIEQYELMKLRILNAGHASIAYASALLDYHFVHKAMADADLVNWLRALQQNDAIPTLKPINGVDYNVYLEKVIERFANPEIGDTIPRLAAYGSDRQPKFIFPTLADAIKSNGSIEGLALELAIWCRYCSGKTESGKEINIIDHHADMLMKLSEQANTRPSAFLEYSPLFGTLCENSRLMDLFVRWLELINAKGVRFALQKYVCS
ncbi:mannitol dehydrogenase family protein [Marinomonas mediterranea]|uniref:mannitol dehydrogenase family protein n=1 Tax=Marinomonas mediterranea TaxID=119864 RepID=UPI0023494F04|nr:mannitol dehydrogenase family protein [Marinomonas mediterranea]WCN15128.1 mannitol dehydrogenase family protein [Marinomonas mediterranea]